MRLLVQGARPVGRPDRWGNAGLRVEPLDLCRYVEVALGPKEVAGLRSADTTHQPHDRVQLRLRPARGEAEVLAASLSVNPAATAIASDSVDFPLPFSPTRNVTFACSSSVSSDRIAGMLKG